MEKQKKENELVDRNEIEGMPEVGEDSTKYGEFISSYFAWISLPKQKERADDLEKITKQNRKKQKKKEDI